MSEVTQTILHDPVAAERGIFGNCLQAAVASMLDKPIEAVPHFVTFLWWPAALELWARGEGLTVKTAKVDEVPDFRCIVGGKSERGVAHVVIGDEGRIVWDPHPSRAGLVTITDATWFEPWPDEDHVCWNCHQEYA